MPSGNATTNDLDQDADQHPMIYQRWLYLADKLEGNPDLLEIPLQNISRWKAAGRLGNDWALEKWRHLIENARHNEEGTLELLNLLRSDGEKARQLKSCSPFPGVLTRSERDQFTCAWTH